MSANDPRMGISSERQFQLWGQLNRLTELDGLAFNDHFDRMINDCSYADIQALTDIWDARGGRNLAGVLIEVGKQGWAGGYNSMLRTLARKKFDMHVVQHNGKTPAFEGLAMEVDYLKPEDLRWAFRHGLNPLAHYPDGASSKSLLSLNLKPWAAQDGLCQLAENTIRRKLKSLPKTEQPSTLDMLKRTALPMYAPFLAELSHDILTRLASRKNTQAAKPRL